MKRYTPVHTQQVQCVWVVEIAAFAYLYYPCSYDKCPESIHLIAYAQTFCVALVLLLWHYLGALNFCEDTVEFIYACIAGCPLRVTTAAANKLSHNPDKSMKSSDSS